MNQQLDPIVAKGYKFFNSRTRENFLVKGIDYYPRPNAGDLNVNSFDYYTEEYRHIWERDILQFQELGLNAIRLYSVDPTNDHSAFMCALNAAGIYVIVALATGAGNCPTCAILSSEAPHCYTSALKIRGQMIIKEFSKYTNTLAFSAGNEVNHYVPPGKGYQWNAPCLKKFVKDMRAYVDRCEHVRHVPIGLIMADSGRDENTLYYNCQDNKRDELEHAEWYGINTYVYCNGTADSFDEAVGFLSLSSSFESYNYSIPVLLTEYGCLSKTFPTVDGYEGQRNFNQAKWFGLPSIQDDFAGGLAFEYSIEKAIAQTPFPFKVFGEQNYGIGYFSPENCDDVNITCEYKRTPSFYNLKKAYEQVHPENITLDDFIPNEYRTGRSTCPAHFPALGSFHWKTDWRISISCPQKSHEIWTCPANNFRPEPNATSTSISTSSDGNFSTTIGIVFVITLIIIHSITRKKSLIQIQSFERFDVWNLDKEAKSLSTEDEDDESSGLVISKYEGEADYKSCNF